MQTIGLLTEFVYETKKQKSNKMQEKDLTTLVYTEDDKVYFNRT